MRSNVSLSLISRLVAMRSAINLIAIGLNPTWRDYECKIYTNHEDIHLSRILNAVNGVSLDPKSSSIILQSQTQENNLCHIRLHESNF